MFSSVCKIADCYERSKPAGSRDHQQDALHETPVFTRLFGDAEGLGESRFWGMLGCGLMGVLDARIVALDCGGTVLVGVVRAPVLA